MHGWTLPGQRLFAARALVREKATMDGASSYQTEIPDRPPHRMFSEASGTHAGLAKIEEVGANGFAAEEPLGSPGPCDLPIAHGQPLLGFES